jgi:hypothetical protein
MGNTCPNTKTMECELCGTPMEYSEIRGVTYKYNDGHTPYYIETTFEYACDDCRKKLMNFVHEHYEWEGMSGFWAEYGRNIHYIREKRTINDDQVPESTDQDIDNMLDRLCLEDEVKNEGEASK